MKIHKISRFKIGTKKLTDDMIARYIKTKLDMQIKADSFVKRAKNSKK